MTDQCNLSLYMGAEGYRIHMSCHWEGHMNKISLTFTPSIKVKNSRTPQSSVLLVHILP